MEEQVSKGRLLRRVDILRRQARRARRLAEGLTNANDRDPLLALAIDADAEADSFSGTRCPSRYRRRLSLSLSRLPPPVSRLHAVARVHAEVCAKAARCCPT